MNKPKCDVCGSEENVSNTWYGSILCEQCENRVEASKRGEITEESQYAESIYHNEQEAV